ncbi:MAG: hypothetical protein GYA21_05180 [Myxococcales bacterium]|nr:hypothetical protein [Myxococcales bacterium]
MAVNIVSKADRWVPIRTALVSVSDKKNLDVLAHGLCAVSEKLRILSTGGTFEALAKILGPERARQHLVQVSDYTGQPETQGGLVKTLDFKIYLGLLTETYNESHQRDLARLSAAPIDLVAVNLYPFTAASSRPGATPEEARANIDIGGPCMLRAAAKNFLRVLPLCDPSDYETVVKKLKANGGRIDIRTRFELARKAFAHTAAYDKAIAEYLAARSAQEIEAVYQYPQEPA